MKKALLFSLAALAVGAAQAQTYAGIEVGTAKADLSELKSDTQNSYAAYGLPVTVTTDDASSAFRLFGGSKLDAKTSIEAGFFGTGEASVKAYGRTSYVYYYEEFSYSASGLDLSALYKPFENGFYLKGGLHASKVEGEYRGSVAGYSIGNTSGSESGIGFLYGAGYEAAISEGLNLRASFVRYQKLGGESDFDMDLISVGLSKSF